MIIEDVYMKLQQENLCGSAYDFSTHFLGKSRSYYGVIKTRKDKPSIEAIATLEVALKNTANLYSSNSHPQITKIHRSLCDLSNDVGKYRVQCTQEKLLHAKYI